jgi:hypothetical protein
VSLSSLTKFRTRVLGVLIGLLATVPISADECSGTSKCVPKEDFDVLLTLLRDKQCQQKTPPTFKLDPVNIVVDQDGRVYYSGSQPHPYTLRMSWCNYDVTATGKVDLVVAKREPPEWGFRFRPKFAGSFLFVDAFERPTAAEAVDVGILWEFLYWRSLNLNLATGFRSAGVGLGLDLTKNFGAFGGYSFSWWTLRHNPQVGLYFAF